MWPIISTGLVALLINLPLGAWRVRVRPFSVSWFVAVHLSVPLILGLRVFNDLGLRLVPLFIALAVAGQILGGMLLQPRRSERDGQA